MIQHNLQQVYIFGLLQCVFSTTGFLFLPIHGNGEVPVFRKTTLPLLITIKLNSLVNPYGTPIIFTVPPYILPNICSHYHASGVATASPCVSLSPLLLHVHPQQLVTHMLLCPVYLIIRKRNNINRSRKTNPILPSHRLSIILPVFLRPTRFSKQFWNLSLGFRV
jgi:hypothetical protein